MGVELNMVLVGDYDEFEFVVQNNIPTGCSFSLNELNIQYFGKQYVGLDFTDATQIGMKILVFFFLFCKCFFF